MKDEKGKEIWNLPYFLNRSKSKSYKEQVLRRHSIVMRFFVDNNLINPNPFDENGLIKPDLILYERDLSERGLKMLSIYHSKLPSVLKWFNYIDKGGKEDNVSHLQKGLEKIKKEEKI